MSFRQRLERLGPPIASRGTSAPTSSSGAAPELDGAPHASRSVEYDDAAPPPGSRARSHARLRALLARADAQARVAPAEPEPARGDALARLAAGVWDVATDGAGSSQARGQRLEQLRALLAESIQRDPPRARLDDSAPPVASVASGASIPSGAPLWHSAPTEHGTLHSLERWLEPDHRHGRVPVRGALERLPATVSALALDPALAGIDLSRMLFLDTETTGLAGGTGTVAFLVGLAEFDDGVLRVTQLIVPTLGDEAPMLVELAKRLAAASCILTYNGKSFDWPLLRTRFVLNRLPAPVPPPHVDLVHAARRIWKARLGGLRLTEIEREVLHHFREDDVAGADIPARYFAYLRDGVADRLAPILEHNQSDLIALAALLALLGERFERAEQNEQPLDALSFGRLALKLRDGARARSFARVALRGSEGDALEPDAQRFCAEVERSLGELAAAAAHYERALALSPEPARSGLHLCLAKLYEHGLKDPVRAYAHARQTELAEGSELHGRRLARLTRKLQRTATAPRRRRGSS